MMNMGSSTMGMDMVFTNSHSTPLYSASWTPNSAGSYAGTCIFLIILASILRGLIAFKSIVEQRWLTQARNRRYVVVKGKTTEAGKIDKGPDAKAASLITAQGVEEPVKVVRAYARSAVPFRLSVDVPRAAIVFVIAGVSYLL
jgi:Ctr copper transporter family